MRSECLEKTSRSRFWCLLGVLLLLITTRYALQIDVPRIVLLVVIALIAILGDRDEIIAMCICCIPMHESIDFFYALVICMCVFILKYHRRIRIGSVVLLVLVIIIWELLHCFQTAFSPVNFLSYIIPFIVLAVLMMSDTEGLDYPFLVRAFAWATLGISLILFVRVLYFSNFQIRLALAGLQRLGSDAHSNIQDVSVSGGQINPNSLGIITVLASAGLMQLRSMHAGKKSDMVLMCLMIVLAALGTSRTYLACLALMIVLLIFSEKGGMKKRLQLTAVLCIAVAVTAAAMAVFFPESFAYFVSRFLVDDLTTGRDKLMIQYHTFIVDRPNVLLFGIGLQDFEQRLIHFYRVSTNTPHNSIQEIIAAWGIPGLFLFAALFLCMYRVSSQKNKAQSLLNRIPLFILLFKSLAGQLLTSPYTMLALSFAYLSLCTDLSAGEEPCIFTRTSQAPRGSGQK